MSSLQTLSLTLNQISTRSYLLNNLVLENLTMLRSIKLTLMLNVMRTEAMIPWMTSFLHSHQRPSTLTELVVKVNLFTAVHLQAIVPPINWARIDWAPLGDVLSAAAFPLLATFQLDVDCVSPGCDAPLQVFVDDATRGLHRLQAPGIFKCAV
ncbi:hypothetical protein B0H13DRAFT_2328003 [Mycena leptocephala]|nr:hypothetical protein B0H13DRAFT_2328003 [Mycena leptocephala]